MLTSLVSSWSRPACARLYSVLSVSRAALAAAPVSNDNSPPESASSVAPPAPNVPSFLRGYAERVVQRRAHLMRERELLARPPKSPANDPRTLAADAEPQTLSAKLSVPFNWVLNHFADSHALEKMKEDDAVSMFGALKRASRSETLQRAFCLPDSHYRTFLSVYNVHLFIMLNEMNRAYKNEYAAKVAEFIFRQAKDDFYKEVKARGVTRVFNLYAKNDDLLQAAHKQWHADCKVAPEDLFRHMLASVWVYVYRAGLPLSEFADAARREELLNGARVLTRYLIDNMAHAQKQDEIAFMRLEFQFLPPHAVRKLSKADAATELDEALVKRRQEWQAPPIQ